MVAAVGHLWITVDQVYKDCLPGPDLIYSCGDPLAAYSSGAVEADPNLEYQICGGPLVVEPYRQLPSLPSTKFGPAIYVRHV